MTAALAEGRIALVIGNSDYEFTAKLANPRNDAQDISTMLQSLGFTVFGGVDLDRRSFIEALTKFGRGVQDSEISLFYYAGHGLQVNGENYFVPIDARIEFKEEIDLFLVSLKDVMQQMDRGSRAKILILDACRDNPFASQMTQHIDRSAVSLGQGLGRVRTEKGTFIAFATEPDAVASDGAGRNSPFTSALLHHMPTSALSVSEMMIRVRNEVIASTRDKQTPWDSSSLVENVYLAGRAGQQAPSPSPQPQAENNLGLRGSLPSGEEAAYEAAVNVDTCGAYDAFIKRYEQSLYGDLARERKRKLCPSEATTKPETGTFEVATLPTEPPNQSESRSLPNPIVDVRGRKVQVRPIPGDDRDMGWVYINNCGMPISDAERLRTKINSFKFKNLRLVPGQIVSFDPGLQAECKKETTITAYTSSTRGAVEGLANLAENELASVLQSRNLNARIEREIDVDTISDRYRLDVWLVP